VGGVEGIISRGVEEGDEGLHQMLMLVEQGRQTTKSSTEENKEVKGLLEERENEAGEVDGENQGGGEDGGEIPTLTPKEEH